MTQEKPFDWTQFTLRVWIDASPQDVFRAWTDDSIIINWFTEKAVIEPRQNGRVYFEWLAGDKLEAKVIEIHKNRRFVFPFGSNNEQVTVSVKKSKSGSICELHQYNMKTTPKAKVSMHMGCREGWTFFLANLKAYLEYGIDLRSDDPKQSYKQGFINS